MKKIKTFFMIFLFLLGISILIYPQVSDYYNKKVQLKEIVNYQELVKTYDDTSYTKYFDEAKRYNEELKKLNDPFTSYDKLKNYTSILSTNSSGMIGYLNISKINVSLPIYHGTTEEVLSIGVGHLEGSSFPTGEVGTHSVLSAHRGLPSSKLFTNLDKLEVGDTFKVSILNKEFTYKIVKIVVVEKDDTSSLKIDNNKDYVTLMTCTPYGINSHRLLVRGERVEDTSSINILNELFKINNITTTLVITFILVFIILLIILLKPTKNNKVEIERYIYPSKYKKKGEVYEK